MNPTLTTFAFWQPYLFLEPENLSQADLDAQLDSLRNDYTVRQDTVTFEHNRKPKTVVHRVVEFRFTCGPRFSLLLEYTPQINGCEKSLSLVATAVGKKYSIGWWDQARWHPYCLRLDELDTLLNYWKQHDPHWPTSSVPLLLLAGFVGLADETERASLQARCESACRTLGFEPPPPDQPIALAPDPRDQYRWENDPELGWLFTSDEYPCYSIRNRQHLAGDHGNLPFALFNQMMRDVRQAAGA